MDLNEKIDEKKDAIMPEMIKAINSLAAMAKKTNKKYQETDISTKKKIIAAVIGGVLIMVAIAGFSRSKRKHRDH